MIKKISLVIGMILVFELLGGLSALLAGNIKGQYQELILPPGAFPGYIFGIVWPILYALLAWACFLILQTSAPLNLQKKALGWFGGQYLLNLLWSPVFFGLRSYWVGSAMIIVMDALVLVSLYVFFKLNKVAGLLLIPYLMWLFMATYLSIGVALLN